jgi:hypothetical protein
VGAPLTLPDGFGWSIAAETIGGVLAAIFIAVGVLLASSLKKIARYLIERATRRLPAIAREDLREEWHAEIYHATSVIALELALGIWWRAGSISVTIEMAAEYEHRSRPSRWRTARESDFGIRLFKGMLTILLVLSLTVIVSLGIVQMATLLASTPPYPAPTTTSWTESLLCEDFVIIGTPYLDCSCAHRHGVDLEICRIQDPPGWLPENVTNWFTQSEPAVRRVTETDHTPSKAPAPATPPATTPAP